VDVGDVVDITDDVADITDVCSHQEGHPRHGVGDTCRRRRRHPSSTSSTPVGDTTDTAECSHQDGHRRGQGLIGSNLSSASVQILVRSVTMKSVQIEFLLIQDRLFSLFFPFLLFFVDSVS
jgi:hypothetical protein